MNDNKIVLRFILFSYFVVASQHYSEGLAYFKVSIIRPGRSRLLEFEKKIIMVGKFKLLFSQPFPYFRNISYNTWNTIGVNMYLNL